MQDKTKNIIIIIEFFVILVVTLILNVVKEDEQISISERRKLAQIPELKASTTFNGDLTEKFEKYFADQFVGRDIFKGIKYWFSINVLKQQDNNKLFVRGNAIYKMEYPLNEQAVEKSAQKIHDIYIKHLQGMNVYYSIIPDKNYYLADNHLKIDYSKMEKIMQNKLKDIEYIDIKNSINIEDFYRTDIHLKQENLIPVVETIKEYMNIKNNRINYIEKVAGEFYGLYYGQVSTKIEPDTIKYLTNDTIKNCITYNYETNKYGKVYDLEKYNTSADKYDIFLSGATPLITIENPRTTTNKELLLFRDSFGSSIAPLMIENYKKITLIDIRYMTSSLLEEYINFKNQDVLFLYSGIVLNENVFR